MVPGIRTGRATAGWLSARSISMPSIQILKHSALFLLKLSVAVRCHGMASRSRSSSPLPTIRSSSVSVLHGICCSCMKKGCATRARPWSAIFPFPAYARSEVNSRSFPLVTNIVSGSAPVFAVGSSASIATPPRCRSMPTAGPALCVLRPCCSSKNPMLWETAVKLAGVIEDGSEDERYCEALAVVVRELLRACGNSRRPRRLARGGLAPWQQRIVATYVEVHLAETIPLAALAKLVDLSPYHFCRAFKQAVGVPPHRYHARRRIERAKTMLEQRGRSVTEIALTLGFSETSSFSTAFRQTTGSAPTEYRRALG